VVKGETNQENLIDELRIIPQLIYEINLVLAIIDWVNCYHGYHASYKS
jgi:hypothetical protein